MAITQEEVLTTPKECYDPEIPVNIVDMGLIYEIRVTALRTFPNPAGDDVELSR